MEQDTPRTLRQAQGKDPTVEDMLRSKGRIFIWYFAMKTKAQKIKDMEQAAALLDKAKSLVFVDFSKTSTKEIGVLKNSFLSAESTYKVIKKRLLGLVFKKKNIPVDTAAFESQLGTVFSSKDVIDAAGAVYRFAKGKEKELPEFKMLGGYDLATGVYYPADEIKRIGMLPSKEILLAQLVWVLASPARSLAYVLNQIAKKGQNN
jgi:large subunit ribosomal protein L10